MRLNLKLAAVGMVAAGSVGLLAPTASAAPRGLAPGEAVVNCVDTNGSNKINGDDLAVLTPLDKSVTEPVPAGTTTLTCTNSALSSETVYVSVPANDTSANRGLRSVTAIQPGQSQELFVVIEGTFLVGFTTT
ncbi:hypothetical protein [Kitasatospora kifunensis]|uniref:Uncharacterized protein n=1 Tax=Kitasatospora kifunensis TaxID=58351 RepID=A0A7W7RAQ1_KITKI|nr:hypothetical protein [Kitasatospora kifunensis]MBB4928506.1 hypothetical protein [Kitasatospora kifunensis]